jgi:(p)ppGpp synthase/HD superfamily hydrolase
MAMTRHTQSRFEYALRYAAHVHAGQVRKGSETPYIAHLLAVTALVMENGGDEEEIIAALLHDAPEDQGGRERLDDIRQRFGARVAGIVEGCTDTFEDPKPDWLPRKKAYLARLVAASPSVRRVAAADKLHNARCILADYREEGNELWARFSAGPDGVLWYYRGAVEALRKAGTDRVVEELDRVVSELERVVRRRPDPER